jgi:hypothetical protein
MSFPSARHKDAVETYLLDRYGPLLNGRSLWSAIGYQSSQAFRKAASRGALPVRTFHIDGRKGLFAYTSDVAHWLSAVGDPVEMCDEEEMLGSRPGYSEVTNGS